MQQALWEQDLPRLKSAADGLKLVDGCDYFQPFLTPESATELLHKLWTELHWQQKAIRMFGKEVMQPRLICWQSDPEVSYGYSGLKLEAADWHPLVAELRSRLRSELGLDFNSVLINAYRNGQDSMGWHADDEPELGANPLIASISLGAERKFRWREKTSGKSCGVGLQPGSLLLLSGGFQHLYQHSVPKTSRKTGLRINLTFRLVQPR